MYPVTVLLNVLGQLLVFLSDLAVLLFSTALMKMCIGGGSVAEWLACWTQAQKVPGSNHSRDAVGKQS